MLKFTHSWGGLGWVQFRAWCLSSGMWSASVPSMHRRGYLWWRGDLLQLSVYVVVPACCSLRSTHVCQHCPRTHIPDYRRIGTTSWQAAAGSPTGNSVIMQHAPQGTGGVHACSRCISEHAWVLLLVMHSQARGTGSGKQVCANVHIHSPYAC